MLKPIPPRGKLDELSDSPGDPHLSGKFTKSRFPFGFRGIWFAGSGRGCQKSDKRH
jgi:hypothetical protein